MTACGGSTACPTVTRVTRARAEAPAAGAAPAMVSSGAEPASADAVSAVDVIQGGPATALLPLSGVPLQAAAPGAGSADAGADSDNDPLFPSSANSEEPPNKETNAGQIRSIAVEVSQDSDSDQENLPLDQRRKTRRRGGESSQDSESDREDVPLAERLKRRGKFSLPFFRV